MADGTIEGPNSIEPTDEVPSSELVSDDVELSVSPVLSLSSELAGSEDSDPVLSSLDGQPVSELDSEGSEVLVYSGVGIKVGITVGYIT